MRRAELCKLQGIDQSLYSEIDPLHLPEVLALIDRYHGPNELYLAVVSLIAALFSTNEKEKVHSTTKGLSPGQSSPGTFKVDLDY
eukprot:3015662-Ditylum_brightwellii.AAC.1